LTARFALADAAAILLFTTIGLISHDALSPEGYARDALPLLGCWFAVALALRLYRRASWRRLLACWILAIPLGVLVRALVLDRALDGDQAAFLGVTLAVSLVFLTGLRRLVAAVS
jgi:hypothetical protein